MPRLTNLTAVRELLDRDREWAAYAIGDLSPGLMDHCQWYAPADGRPALLLLFEGFEPPILFAMGDGGDLPELFREIRAAAVSLHVQPPAIVAMAPYYEVIHTRTMRRMSLRPDKFAAVATSDVRPVGMADLAAVSTLYDDGHRRGEGPTFFHASMLRQGTFHGIWEDGALVAVAGTHLYSPEEGICTIGNVYTLSDRRGRGLGARVTSAVAAKALRDGIRTIVLNVAQDNTAAQRIYERLGFAWYCDFLEGEAVRVAR